MSSSGCTRFETSFAVRFPSVTTPKICPSTEMTGSVSNPCAESSPMASLHVTPGAVAVRWVRLSREAIEVISNPNQMRIPTQDTQDMSEAHPPMVIGVWRWRSCTRFRAHHVLYCGRSISRCVLGKWQGKGTGALASKPPHRHTLADTHTCKPCTYPVREARLDHPLVGDHLGHVVAARVREHHHHALPRGQALRHLFVFGVVIGGWTVCRVKSTVLQETRGKPNDPKNNQPTPVNSNHPAHARTCTAAAMAEPQEPPQRSPSSRMSRRAMRKDSRSVFLSVGSCG